jgi:hypothetical protein
VTTQTRKVDCLAAQGHQSKAYNEKRKEQSKDVDAEDEDKTRSGQSRRRLPEPFILR